MKPNKLLLSALIAGSLWATGASALTVTLDPTAANVGAPLKAGGNCAGTTCVLSTDAAFNTIKATTEFGSILDIASLTGTATTGVSATEQGYFKVATWSSGAHGVTTNYDIYATFSLSATGSFNSTNVFTVSSISSLTATVYGVPGGSGTSGLAFNTPGVGGADAFGIVNYGTNSFQLGTAAFAPAPATATATNLGGGSGATSLQAILNFTPATGTTGAGVGFWKAPSPFLVSFNTSATGNQPDQSGFGTTVSTSGGHTFFTTNVSENTGSGSGNISFDNAVPEPGSIALMGLALAALGFLRRRGSSGMAGA